MKFRKIIFGTFLNLWGVYKYEESDKIIVRAENVETGKKCAKKIFNSEKDYENWIDNIVDDETAIYNKALAVKRVLEVLPD